MKAKKSSKTNQKSRTIFFAIALTYNLLLGLYLKDFFCIVAHVHNFLLTISITYLVFRH